MILMFTMLDKAQTGFPLLILGGFSGLSIGISAFYQGKAGAAASDAQGETGQGLTNYLAALGIIETVAIFTMVFTLIAIGKIGA
jgi:V/A-type H+-transporting ATPase subunit K